ncbi:MAG: hypothetical protein IJV15_15725 [Lachnospiraceae bacterium]|nr:hypothetical protein [Lachnospiraceae bacterium]
MKNFEYTGDEVKSFLNGLFTNEKYDSFYLFEAKADVSVSYYINGKINKDFYDKEEYETLIDKDYISWHDIKGQLLEYIKADRLPIKLKIILMFNNDNIGRLIEMNNLPIHPDNVRALFLNINYYDGKLSVTTGTSLNVFTLDKSLEELWDKTVEKYYN